jgi:hypothetical protein
MTDTSSTPPSGHDARGRFLAGNREGRRKGWVLRAFTAGERHERARVARGLERAEYGSRRVCLARATEAVVARRLLEDVAQLDAAARVASRADVRRAARLLRDVERAIERGPMRLRVGADVAFDPIPFDPLPSGARP